MDNIKRTETESTSTEAGQLKKMNAEWGYTPEQVYNFDETACLLELLCFEKKSQNQGLNLPKIV